MRLSTFFQWAAPALLLLAYSNRSTVQCFQFQAGDVSLDRESASALSRRKWIQQTLQSSGLVVATVLVTRPAQAACLPGDTSKEYIGVYKVPLDPLKLNDLSSDFKRNLKQYAPDVQTDNVGKIGVPRSYNDALEVLQAQRLAVDDIIQVVKQGKLEEAGVKVLNLLPRVTMAGTLVLRGTLSSSQDSSSTGSEKETQSSLSIQQLRETQLQSALDNVLNSFGECDVLIGQGLRGELGVVTVAQLVILQELQNALRDYDNFLALVQKK